MRSFAVLLYATSALAVAVSPRPCVGRDPPIPFQHRQHRGLVYASSIIELGPSFDTWYRNMAEIAWRIVPIDNGYMDEGQPFEFVTALPVGSRPHRSYEIGNIDMGIDGARNRWLAHLRESKVMLKSRTQGSEMYLLDAFCAGVPVILSVASQVSKSSGQWFLDGSNLWGPFMRLEEIDMNNADGMVEAINRIVLES